MDVNEEADYGETAKSHPNAHTKTQFKRAHPEETCGKSGHRAPHRSFQLSADFFAQSAVGPIQEHLPRKTRVNRGA